MNTFFGRSVSILVPSPIIYFNKVFDHKFYILGVAQVKIMKNPDLLQTASEQFLGKKEHEIKSTVLQTLEGHLRAILGKYLCILKIARHQ